MQVFFEIVECWKADRSPPHPHPRGYFERQRDKTVGGEGRWSVERVTISTWAIGSDRNKAIDIEEWSICGGGRLERFYYIVWFGRWIDYMYYNNINAIHSKASLHQLTMGPTLNGPFREVVAVEIKCRYEWWCGTLIKRSIFGSSRYVEVVD